MGKTPIRLEPKDDELGLIYLINEGSRLNKEKQAAEAELDYIKQQITDRGVGAGCYLTPDGNSVSISDSDKFSEPDPEAVKTALRAKRFGKYFLQCVKVQIAEAKKYLSETELSELREQVGTIRRYTFK